MSKRFPSLGEEPIGLYPVVDSVEWLKKLLPLGVQTIQLRLKNQPLDLVEESIAQSVEIAQSFNVRLFINDYWEMAIQQRAYGVHLGQQDLQQASLQALAASGLRVGISTHSPTEIDTALDWHPTYIAFGPIYETKTKEMPYAPQGLERLAYWVKKLNYPMVAIGGISLERLPDVVATGVNGVAMISAITQAADPIATTQKFLAALDNYFT